MLSGILGGIHWRAALVGYSAGSAGYSARSNGEPLWRDTWWDPLSGSRRVSRQQSGSPVDPAEYPARAAGHPALTGILGGLHWRTALAGYWVEAWCRSIANADSNIKSNNPFKPKEQRHHPPHTTCPPFIKGCQPFTSLRRVIGVRGLCLPNENQGSKPIPSTFAGDQIAAWEPRLLLLAPA